MPLRLSQPSFMWLVSTTKVSPSQCPVEKPLNVCSASSGGGGRPPIQQHRPTPNDAPNPVVHLAHAERVRTPGLIRRGMRGALMLGHAEPRAGVGFGSACPSIVERQSEVV